MIWTITMYWHSLSKKCAAMIGKYGCITFKNRRLHQSWRLRLNGWTVKWNQECERQPLYEAHHRDLGYTKLSNRKVRKSSVGYAQALIIGLISVISLPQCHQMIVWRKLRGIVCFSCLKRAGRVHRTANCSRRCLCTELVNSSPCNKNHHPLLHEAISNLIGMLASTMKTKDALLPVVTAFVVGKNGKGEEAKIFL